MNSKLSNKLLTELINLPGVKVKSYQQHDTIGIIVVLEANNKQARCHRCGKKSKNLHQNHRYVIKDLPLSTQPVYLEINRRQFKCLNCKKPFSEELDYVNKNRSYTKRLAEKVVQQVLGNDIKSVASQNQVSEEEIERMLKDVGEELIEKKPTSIKRLGIDEIALVKGQGNYCAVLVDIDKGKLRRNFSKTYPGGSETMLARMG